MDMEKYKILESDFVGKGVSAQPNPMEKPEDEAKAVFDELVKDVVTPKFNEFVEAMSVLDFTSDEDKPVSKAMQEALDGKVDKEEGKVLSDNNYTDEDRAMLFEFAGSTHGHQNKTVLDSVTAQDVSDWRGGNVLLKNNTKAYTPTDSYHPATKKYVDDKVVKMGGADMAMSVYDPQGKETDIFAYADNAASRITDFDNPLAWVGCVYESVKTEMDGAAAYVETWKRDGVLLCEKTSIQQADGWTEMFKVYKNGFLSRNVEVRSMQDAAGNWRKTVEEHIVLM